MMIPLPPGLAADYRPATTWEVRSWSFGQVSARRATAGRWRKQRGTLDDQAIFGTVRDCECACGKCRGPSYRGIICDWCGVKITSPTVRRERFGHIEFTAEVQHPLGTALDKLSAFPILPALYFSSPAGESLAGLYEKVVEGAFTSVLEQLVAVILPAVQFAHEWKLTEAVVLARGLALETRDQLV